MAYDMQVIAQAIVYFVICALNFAMAIPLGVTLTEFHGQCTLYNDFDWKNATYFICNQSRYSNCTFPVYFPVALIFYTLIVGVYYMYKACSSKDPTVGFEMWVIPPVVATSLIVIVMFGASCVISVGLRWSCDSFLRGQKINPFIKTCGDVEQFRWLDKSISGAHYYQYPKVSEIAGWITFLMWVVQLSLCILRFVRNHRLRRQASTHKPCTVGLPDLCIGQTSLGPDSLGGPQ